MTTRYALALSVGPVGRFIAAGRSSRDLWFGSTWLSEAVRHVADRIAIRPEVELIVPTRARLDGIRARFQEGEGAFGGRVSNKVRALVTLDAEPSTHDEALRAIADEARREAMRWLLRCLDDVHAEFSSELGLDHEAFLAQRRSVAEGDFLEFAASWTRLSEDEAGRSFARAARLRDGAVRGFTRAGFSLGGRERSSLDAGRDDVLLAVGDDTRPLDTVRAHGPLLLRRMRLGVRWNDRLDAVALARRLWTRLGNPADGAALAPLPFTPTTRMAADAWLEGVGKHPVGEKVIRRLREVMARSEDDPTVSKAREPETGARGTFPYEASVLLEGGADALCREFEHLGASSVMENLREQRRLVRRLHLECGTPIPYYALVEMDGDGIGVRLSNADLAAHKTLVSRLDGFADEAEERARRFGASVLYAAGDELILLIPVDKALETVTELAKQFHERTGETMSAGVVFAHAKDDLRSVRAAAREALGVAKRHAVDGGGGMCVVEIPRSGVPRAVSGGVSELAGDLDAWREAFCDEVISLRTEQMLLDLHERFSTIDAAIALARQRIVDQLSRSAKAHPRLDARVAELAQWSDVERLAREIRIASRVADIEAQRRPR